MKTLVLLASLASATVQSVAVVPEATGAEIRVKVVLAADAAPKAAPAEPFLPLGRTSDAATVEVQAEPSAAESRGKDVPRGEIALDGVPGCGGAFAYVKSFTAAQEGEADAEMPAFALGDAPGAQNAVARAPAVLPESSASDAVRLSGLVHHRFLSGPWSAARRLEAARLRGDADEVRRMEELLGELVVEAVIVREGGDR